MSERPPFPAVLDATTMSAFKSCPRKAFLEYFHHWKIREQSVHLHAGAAYAHGLETARRAFYIDGNAPADAVALGVGALLTAYGDFECPPDSAKSAERTAGALEYYFESYPLGLDKAIPISVPGKRGIEFSFVEPLPVLHPESGEPILYSGRMDMICDFDGMRLGEDDKTTSSLGGSWAKQWDLRSQFTGYVWLAKQGGIKVDGFLIRGVSILKTKYDTQQAITHRPEWQLDRWEEQLGRDIKRMIRCWEEGYFDYNLDHACAEYGGCPFRNVCLMKDPTQLLEMQFQRRQWNPITREERVL